LKTPTSGYATAFRDLLKFLLPRRENQMNAENFLDAGLLIHYTHQLSVDEHRKTNPETQMNGWTGKVLSVDLTTGEIETQPLDVEQAQLFLGGRGLGARLLWDLVGPNVHPLDAENVLIFATGPLTATGYQTSNRFSLSTKSPLTGTILDANSGGYWGMQLKRSGYDALIVRGAAEGPVWLEITPDACPKQGGALSRSAERSRRSLSKGRRGAALHDAAHLWGERVGETTAALGQLHTLRKPQDAGSQPPHQPGPASIWHGGDGEHRQRDWCVPRAQLSPEPVRGSRAHLGRGACRVFSTPACDPAGVI
jgi:hypothetical protein